MYIGIDVGSRAAKGILLNGKSIVGSALCDTGTHPRRAGEHIFEHLLSDHHLCASDIHKIVGTGYGRISMSMTDKNITELSCHAKGAHYLCPSVRTVIDIGGQDSKAIRVNQAGGMEDFAMNDKCAAGTGRFFEVMARALEMDLDDFSTLPAGVENVCEINSMCAVFAETEIISLLAREIPVESIASGINQSFAKRIAGMAKRIGIRTDVMLVGGVAKNNALRQSVEALLDVSLQPATIDPQLIGALGAAVFASQL